MLVYHYIETERNDQNFLPLRQKNVSFFELMRVHMTNYTALRSENMLCIMRKHAMQNTLVA